MNKQSKQYQHLFFDLDHTLWDFENNSRAVLKALYHDFRLEKLGIPASADFQVSFEQHNDKFWERFRKGQINRETLRWKRLWHTLLDFNIRDQQLAYDLSDIYLQLLPTQSRLVPDALNLLEYCRDKGYKMHLITNGFQQTQKMKLTQSGIADFFQNVVTAQDCGFLKPNREIFAFAINAAAASVTESLMIGDALEADILGAQEFGMDQAFFNCRKIDHSERPTYEIAGLSALKEIL